MVAQSIECLTCDEEIEGSTPGSTTLNIFEQVIHTREQAVHFGTGLRC